MDPMLLILHRKKCIKFMYIWFISCRVMSYRFDFVGVSELLFYVIRNVKIDDRPCLSHVYEVHIPGNSTHLEATEDKRRES